MALTAEEKHRLSKQFVRIAYKKNNRVATVDVPAILAAAEAIHTHLSSAAIQTAINNQFPEPFKSNTGLPEKAFIVAAVASFLAGELPN